MIRVLIAGDVGPKHVGITPSYLRALRAVDAVAAVAYALDEEDAGALANAYDALLMPGGNDLPAELFGQSPHPACSYDDPMRDLSDRRLMEAFHGAGKRVLGICRGMQATNVFLGGTLHQHLPDAFDPVLWHSGNNTGRHKATILPDTLLASLLGEGEIAVNSSHHQAVDKLGRDLRLSATAPDGVIEAIEGKNLLLVQWHPERMSERMKPLFEWLISAR